LRLALVDYFSPVTVLTLQLVFEVDLFLRDEAKSGELDLQIVSPGRQLQFRDCRRLDISPISLFVSYEFLNVDRRGELVDNKMARIDNLDAFACNKPQFAIPGLRDPRAVGASGKRAKPDSVYRIPNRRLDPPFGVRDPSVEFGPPDSDEAAGGI
jgi:hypothetical protein